MNSPAASSLAFSLSPTSSECEQINKTELVDYHKRSKDEISSRLLLGDENLGRLSPEDFRLRKEFEFMLSPDSEHGIRNNIGVRMALSPLSPLGSSMNSNSFMNRESSIEKRSRFSPTTRKRRGVSSLTQSSKENEYSSAKKARLHSVSTPNVSSGTKPAVHEKDMVEKSPSAVYEFDYHAKTVSAPTSTLVQQAYNVSLELSDDENDFLTHQQKLRASGCSLLSFEDVILPSIIAYQKQILRTLQGKAQGHKDTYATVAFQYGRMALDQCARRSVKAVQKCRAAEAEVERDNQKRLSDLKKRQRENERNQKKLEKERIVKERETANTLLMMQKQVESDKRRRDRKKNWPRNKELWNEVALLMTDLRRLEKEERVWRDASDVLDKLEVESKDQVEKIPSINVEDNDTIAGCEPMEDVSLSMVAVMNHCALSASRIKSMAESVHILMTDSDNVRRSLYDVYNNYHKLSGYLGVKDPKALLRALALG